MLKTLIVEDVVVIRRLLANVLREHCESEFAENGGSAVKKFHEALSENTPFKLVCMDILMPVQDGISALKKMRELEKAAQIDEKNRAVILMITSMNEQEFIVDSIKAGCNGYIIKPIDPVKVLDEVKKHGLI